ncbi:MAG: DUF5819 family protein [Flammeovirgaceae bacterium]
MTRQIFQNLISRMRKRLEKISVFIGMGMLSAHFFFIGLYLLPDNPIKHQFKYELSSYVNPFFSQSWNLFSPTPVNTNMTLLIQFKTVSGGAQDTSVWVDVYKPHIDEKKNSFWSPAQRISKFMTSCMQSTLEGNKALINLLKEDSMVRNDSVKAKKMYQAYIDGNFGTQSIIQYSHYVFNKIYNSPEKNYDSVFVRFEIFDAKFPRFSKREQDFFDSKNYFFSKLRSKYYALHGHEIAGRK